MSTLNMPNSVAVWANDLIGVCVPIKTANEFDNSYVNLIATTF